jgi:hypothetical protein
MEDDEWPILCSARPEFVLLSEADVLAAVGNDTAGEQPVTKEVMPLAARSS